jgi:hypothetical protein
VKQVSEGLRRSGDYDGIKSKKQSAQGSDDRAAQQD